MAKNGVKIFLFLLLLAGCKYSRYVPEGEFLYWDREVDLKDGGIISAEAENVLRQNPNQKLFFSSLRPGLAIHSWGDGSDSAFWSRLGKAPVILDQIQLERDRKNLALYYFNRGYFQCEVESKVNFFGKQRAGTYFEVSRGPRYKIGQYDSKVHPELQTSYDRYQKQSLIRTESFYDANRLEAERKRLAAAFRNEGYFNFSENFIRFEIDTNQREETHEFLLRIIIEGIPRRTGDSIFFEAPQKHRFRKVSILPDYQFEEGGRSKDSMQYADYQIRYSDLEYKPRYLADAIHFEPGNLFRERYISETYDHLARYGGFKITDIQLQPVGSNLIDAEIRLIPQEKRSFTAQIEATNTSGNYGISGSVGIINRNLFGSGEALSFDINSGLEYQPTVGTNAVLSRTIEFGAELKLQMQRFLLPFSTEGLLPKRMLPQSSFSLFVNRTNRVEFKRESYGGRLSYQWRENAQKSHQVDLLEVSFSNIFDIEDFFINQLDPIQVLAFSSEFISSTSWKFTYNGQESVRQKRYDFFSSDIEIGGSIQSLIANSSGILNENNGVTNLWNVPVYQFARVELDYRYYIRPSREQLYVFRLNSGYILPYGISTITSPEGTIRLPPFSRFFFLGGTNDMRAWPAYRAGGGIATTTNYEEDGVSSFAIGTLKFLSNIEYRFPLYSSLKGAVFLDAGNIWLTGGLETEESGFRLGNFARDLYLGSGFGLRLDLDFFVIRFDTGLRLRDPGYWAQNEEWVIFTKDIIPNLTYNIALGYPF